LLRVEVSRGDLVESVHQVAACALSARGDLLFASGEIDDPVYLRSSAKPFIAATAIEAGVRERFGLSMEEIAVMSASHSGEPFHVEAVRSILQKSGFDESDLQCGPQIPYNEAAAQQLERDGEPASAIYNNCSGKHAGILALCRVMGVQPDGYLDAHHPVQQRILAFCARLSDDDPAHWPLGVDGCGIPVYATSLRRAALAFARFATLEGLPDRDAQALLVVRDAMVSHPEFVAGTGELDTALMAAAGGAIACKVGAEGVHGVASMPGRFGYVSKVLDGTSRARGPATIAALRALGALSEAQATKLDSFERPIVYNRAHRAVGQIRPTHVAVETASTS
jgi:L-asparaginase II